MRVSCTLYLGMNIMRPLRPIRSIAFLLAFSCLAAVAQDEVASPNVVKAIVVDGDTLPSVDLGAAEVYAHWSRASRDEKRRYDRLTRHVLKVYPYARITAGLLAEYEHDLATIARAGDQDLYIKLAEAELRAEFEEEVKGMTVSQGRVLMKLIDRETGQTTYALVKQLRGNFQAWLWQGVAQLFGNDLKAEYDLAGEDRNIEHIVQRILSGELQVAERRSMTAKAHARLERRKAGVYKKYGLEQAPTSMN